MPTVWPKQKWLYEAPSSDDAAGKVVIHWFCIGQARRRAPMTSRASSTCATTAASTSSRIIDGNATYAKKLDPIRESEGVGKGTVAIGPGVTKLMKQIAVKPGPSSIVADTDGKVAMVTVDSDPNALDARDAEVNKEVGRDQGLHDLARRPDLCEGRPEILDDVQGPARGLADVLAEDADGVRR